MSQREAFFIMDVTAVVEKSRTALQNLEISLGATVSDMKKREQVGVLDLVLRILTEPFAHWVLPTVQA